MCPSCLDIVYLQSTYYKILKKTTLHDIFSVTCKGFHRITRISYLINDIILEQYMGDQYTELKRNTE